MKLTKKKIKRDVDVCLPKTRLVSKPVKFGQRTLQLVVEDNCGYYMAALADPKVEPYLFEVNPRFRGRRRRVLGRRRVMIRHSLHFDGHGKTPKAAVVDLNKNIASQLRTVKQFERWLANNPIEIG